MRFYHPPRPQAESNQTLTLAFRQPVPLSLAPCANFTDTGACAAIAKSSAGADLTPAISTAVHALCSKNSSSSSSASSVYCGGCSVAALTLGACLPGRYRVVYEVVDPATDVQAAVHLDVSVEQVCSRKRAPAAGHPFTTA
jgi:hypothetical protein